MCVWEVQQSRLELREVAVEHVCQEQCQSTPYGCEAGNDLLLRGL